MIRILLIVNLNSIILVSALPPLPGKLTPLHPDHFSPGGLMEQSYASLQRGRQG